MTTPLRRWVFWPVVLLTLLVIVGWVRGRYYLDKLFVNKDTYWIEFGSGDGVWVQSSPWVNDSPPVGVYQFGSYPRNNLFRILGGTRDTHHNFRVNDGWRGFVMVSEQYPDANGVFDDNDYNDGALGWNFTAIDHGQDAESDPVKKRHLYDTTLLGYSNTGHLYGDILSDADRTAVIEYLKTL